MKRKENDERYFALQNGRSGMGLNNNTLPKYIHNIPVELNNTINVLDIGCRAGAHTVQYFHDKGCNSYGIDIGTNAEAAWSNHKLKSNLKRADIHEGIPFDLKFDIISISHTLEHCHTPELALKHVYDGLKIGGYVWGIVPIETSDANHGPHYCTFHSHEEHLDIYRNAGFEIFWSQADNQRTVGIHGNSYIWAKKI